MTKNGIHIRESTIRALRALEEGMARAGQSGRKPAWTAARIRKEIIRPLLNKFQAKVRTPVVLHCYAGTIWMHERGPIRDRYRNLVDALEMVANPLSLGVTGGPYVAEERTRYEQRVVDRFPEMLEIQYIAYEMDAMPNRIGIGDLVKPTVKPYAFVKRQTRKTPQSRRSHVGRGHSR